MKFAAIFSSNLDEFFMVRVAGLLEQEQAHVGVRSRDGLTPGQALDAIRERVARADVTPVAALEAGAPSRRSPPRGS